jgi:hypothetical protein
LLVVQAAALGWAFLRDHAGSEIEGLQFSPLETVFPALTCPVQASFRIGQLPSAHGMVANGLFDRVRRRTGFWDQSAGLVAGERIWHAFRAKGRRVAMLFWQQSLGEVVDMVLSPAPIHRHHGGLIQDCYGKPDSLYGELCRRLGRPFDLKRYWGPTASGGSSNWIARATVEILAGCPEPPDLCLTYLPVLDYDLQRYGPAHARSRRALRELMESLALLRQACDRHGFEFLAYGDYAIESCRGGAVFPNRALRQAGLLRCRPVRRMLYPDPYESRAFAMVDHQVAHVYVRSTADVEPARQALLRTPGVGSVLTATDLAERGLAHSNSGELVVLAAVGHWLAYSWWERAAEAPEYAGHVDIHNKPGYDPCELFWGWPPGSVSLDAARVGGSHGLTGRGREACWASSFLKPEPRSLVQLSGEVRQWLDVMA